MLFPAWSADGHSVSFIRNDLSCLPPYYCGKNRLYTINTDGTGLAEVVGPETGFDVTPDNPQWSSRGDLGFTCDVVLGFSGQNKRGICVIGPGTFSKLRIEPSQQLALGRRGRECTEHELVAGGADDPYSRRYLPTTTSSAILKFSVSIRMARDSFRSPKHLKICSGRPEAPINHAESTLLQVFFLKSLKPFGIDTFEKQGEGWSLWLTKCSKRVSVGKIRWNPNLPFSVHTSKFRIPQVFYLTLTKTPGVWGYSSQFGTTLSMSSRV